MRMFKQRGSAFIIFIVVLVLGSLSVLLSGLNQGIAQKTENREQTIKALAEAKAALIGHALTYAETHKGQPPGYLPCPDFDGDGDADAPCNNSGESTIGLFPWKTLGLAQLWDGNGDCLWYAVSGTYKNSPKQSLDNDTNGLFRIKDYKGNILIGQKPEEQAIAVLFSPGVMLANSTGTQSRGIIDKPTECSSKNANSQIRQAQNFLEISVAGPGLALDGKIFDFTADLPQYSTSGPLKGRVIFNDTVLPITPTDFEPVYLKMSQWVGEKVRNCLKTYMNLPKTYINSQSNLPYQSDIPLDLPWATTMNIATTDAYYYDVTNQLFGHISTPKTATPPPAIPPATPAPNLTNTVVSNPKLSNKWTIDPDANRPNTVISYCFDETLNITYQDWYWWWWTKWKEQVFVAINEANMPVVSMTTPGVSNNLRVAYGDINSPSYVDASFIVFVAGRRLSYHYKDSLNVERVYTQVRDTVADKSNIVNYLEPFYQLNTPSIGKTQINPEIATNQTTFFVKEPTSLFNDVICNQDKCFFTH
ncbi:MAG: hypothetical protein PHP00_12660 [Thiotrichaceae bacterium]|nr:hypothetical protein [Thiotrichaceae bacterium]